MVLAAVGVLWGGCGDGGRPTLKVANWAGPEEIAIEEANLDGFRQLHPEVRVILEPIPRPGEYRQKMLTSLAADTAPDVFLLDAVHVAEFLEAGVLLDLMPFVARWGLDLTQYYPEALEIARRAESLFALPKDFTPLVVFYNGRLFAEAGLPSPSPSWTWQDFRRLAAALTVDADGDGRPEQYGTVTETEFFSWPCWVWSNHGDFLDPTGQRATGYLDGKATLQALRFLVELSTRHGVAAPPGVSESGGGALGMFLSGRVAMAVSGHWWMPQIRAALGSGKLEVRVVPVPTPAGGKHVTVLYEAGWAVCDGTRHPELAAELAVHLASEEANRRRAVQGVAIPAHRRLAREIVAADTSGVERVFFEEIEWARAPWGVRMPQAPVVEKHAEEAMASALLEGQDLAGCLREAARRVDAELTARRETSE